MRIGLGQIDMGFEEKEKAMALCSQFMAKAAEQNVDFILFPEMSLTGFTMKTATLCEALEDSPTVESFRKEAIKHNMAVCFGLPVNGKESAENHCLIIGKTGEILADYTKIHPFSYGTESKYYSGGDQIISCQIEKTLVSPFVCYDLRFPEVFQIASKDSLILTVIANWPIPRREHWITLLKARAIENQAFVIGVNRTGHGGGLDYSGDSMVISPLGEVLADCGSASALTVVDIHPQQALDYRESFPLKADRKVSLYHTLSKEI